MQREQQQREQHRWTERRHGERGYGAPAPRDDGLLLRLQNVIDTREAVEDCSRALLARSDTRERSIRVWKEVFQDAVGERNVGKALSLLYVANDVLQCPHHGLRWQEDFGPHLCDVYPRALNCARSQLALDVHRKMVRLPDIWRERRVLRSGIAEQLVGCCYESSAELQHAQQAPPSGVRQADEHQLSARHPLQQPPRHPVHHLQASSKDEAPDRFPQTSPAVQGSRHFQAPQLNAPLPAELPPPPQHLLRDGGPYHPPSHQPYPSSYSQAQPLHSPHTLTVSPVQALPSLGLQGQQSAATERRWAPTQQEATAYSSQSTSAQVQAAIPAISSQYGGSSTLHVNQGAPVVPDPNEVEREQALYDIEEAVGLLQLVKKCVLERKLQDFEQKHADAKRCLEAKHAAALSPNMSPFDAQRLHNFHQKEVGDLEAQHEEMSEHLRLKWVLELKEWADGVSLLRERLQQKIPDARWLSGFLRKAHRAQRCHETAQELETFLTRFHDRPDQLLSSNMWGGASPAGSPPPPPLPPDPPPPPPPEAPPGSLQVRDDPGKGREEPRQSKKERKEQSKKKSAASQAVIDESCPLYRCQGCDKVFVVRGMLSVSDLASLNAGNKRYADSKTAREARDAHRAVAHPNLKTSVPIVVNTAVASTGGPSSPCRNGQENEVGQGMAFTASPRPPSEPSPRPHASEQAYPVPQDPRLRRKNDPGVRTHAATAAASSVPTEDWFTGEDFVPAPSNGTRESIDGYVYKYGKQGAGYYRIVSAEAAPPSCDQPGLGVPHEHVSNCSGKKTIAEMIQDRLRKKELAEKERERKDMEHRIRLEAEAKLREELEQIKSQLEKDRLLLQQQKEQEERERQKQQREEDERLRAELRAMKDQLDRQERDLGGWDRQRQMASEIKSRPQPILEERSSGRAPSPLLPSKLREGSEEGEIREDSPPRPSRPGDQAGDSRASSPMVPSSRAPRSYSPPASPEQIAKSIGVNAREDSQKSMDMEQDGEERTRQMTRNARNAAKKPENWRSETESSKEDKAGDDHSSRRKEGVRTQSLFSRIVSSSDDEVDEAAQISAQLPHVFEEERPAGGGAKTKGKKAGDKRKATASSSPQGKNSVKKSALLKEFSRAEVRAGEALLTLYDYWATAAQQMEAISGSNGAPPNAKQISNDLVQKELDNAVAARIEVGARIKGRWQALKGGLTWFPGSILKVNGDETVDVQYDDGDQEQSVDLRFIQLLSQKPKKSLLAQGSKGGKRKSVGGEGNGAKRHLSAALVGNGALGSFLQEKEGANVEATDTGVFAEIYGVGATEADDERVAASETKRTNKKGARQKAAGSGRTSGARQSKTRLVVRELPDAQPDNALEECLLMLDAVLETKVAKPLLKADASTLFPLLVQSIEEAASKNADKTPTDFVAIRNYLAGTCQALKDAAAGSGGGLRQHYRFAQHVREDVVRVMRLVNESWTARQPMRVCCTKVFEAFNDLYEVRILPPNHQMCGTGPVPFKHGLHWLGQRVRVFWKDDHVWYAGCIDDHYGSDRYHVIYDDDGLEEWITLPSVDVHMISVDWEPPLEPRLLWAGDAVLCRDTGAEERGAPPGLLYRAQVLDTLPSSKSASIRWARGVWPLPEPEEDEAPSDEEELLDVQRAQFVRCDDNNACQYANARVVAREGESMRDIAQRYALQDVKLVCLNKIEHPAITPTSQLARGTPVLLPIDPRLMQRQPQSAPLDTVVEWPLPQLAHTADIAQEDSSSQTFLQWHTQRHVRGRVGSRHATRAPSPLYGGVAARAGASQEMLGARVVVECVTARFLGTVACYDVTTSHYCIVLDSHGASGGIGDVAALPICVSTPLPSPDVHVVAEMAVTSRESSPEACVRAANDSGVCVREGKGAVQISAMPTSSPETPPANEAQAAPTVGNVTASQLASLVGMKVTRGFDGVSGTVTTLVPGSDVVMIEWEDGDCEDMHVSDMQRQGLL